MARTTIIAGNWKMNLLPDDAWELVAGLKEELVLKANLEVAVFPQSPLLPLVSGWLDGSFITYGAQNSSMNNSGAFTGEVSPLLLRTLGCKYSLVGHSERRELFGETNEMVAEKAKALLAVGIKPIVCVGESLEEREAGTHIEKITTQVKAVFACLDPEDYKDLVFAYEPIWAIGTGKTASAEQANEIHQVIRGQIKESVCEIIANSTSILYGGSVKGSNAKEILGQSDVDGVLVGGASLQLEDFTKIVQSF